MIPRSPLPFEGGPEEPGGDDDRKGEGSGTPLGDQVPPDDASAGGWVPPHARHWRHPSEIDSGRADDQPGVPRQVPALGPGRRRQAVGTAIVATSAAAAVVAGLLLLAGAGSTPDQGARGGPTPTLAEVIGCCRYVPAAARDALEGMVSLRVTTAHGQSDVCGVAVAADGLVATTLDALAGARSITAVTSTGRRERARLVAGDPKSDVALLRVDGHLSTAPFTERTSSAGEPALVVAMDPSASSRSTRVMWAGSVVRSVGNEITRGQASGMGGIDADAPSMPTVAGATLVEPDGRVLGLLDRAASSSSVKVFLPAALVVGVAHVLAESGRVHHGWLGVVGKDMTASVTSPTTPPRGVSTTVAAVHDVGGVMVVKVESGGPAAAVLRPDDVITSVDHASLHSMAQMRSLLYVMRPGERVRLGIVRGGASLSVALELSASP